MYVCVYIYICTCACVCVFLCVCVCVCMKVGRVRPRINVSWGWEDWALDHTLITPPRNSAKTPSGWPSYAHAPVGQRQASIRMCVGVVCMRTLSLSTS